MLNMSVLPYFNYYVTNNIAWLNTYYIAMCGYCLKIIILNIGVCDAWAKFDAYHMLGKISSRRHLETFFLFFPENRLWHFMQIVSSGDNLQEMSKPVFLGNIRKMFLILLSAELTRSMVLFKQSLEQ